MGPALITFLSKAKYTISYAVVIVTYEISVFWGDSPLVGLGLLLIHEDFCGF